MPLPGRLFLKLSELAEKWGATEGDLLHWGVIGLMRISVSLDILEDPPDDKDFFKSEESRKQMFVIIKSSDLLKFALGSDTIKVYSFYNDKGETVSDYKWEAFGGRYLSSDVNIDRDVLLVMTSEIARMETEHPELLSGRVSFDGAATAEAGKRDLLRQQLPVEAAVSPGRNAKDLTKVGGRPKGPLSEAIEYAYLYFREQGNTEILRAGKIKEFMVRMKELADEKNPNFVDYISERIKNVKITKTVCSITTHDRYIKASDEREIILKSRTYNLNDVSKILSSLRKKYCL